MTVLKVFGVGVLLYLILAGVVWLLQERIAFPAPARPLPDPALLGVLDAEIVEVETADGIALRGWYLHPSKTEASDSDSQNPDPEAEGSYPGLLWFYGNFETVGVLGPAVQLLRPPGWGVLILDIRGYGESDGSPAESGFYLDAEAAWDFLASRPEIDPGRIAVYGRSLGTALATHVASLRPVSGVILEAPFTSGPDLAAKFYWWFPRFAVRLKLNNLKRAGHIDAPLLVMHGSEDEIVPVTMGKEVAAAAPAGSFEIFEGAGHNEMMLGDADRFRSLWIRFLGSLESGSRRVIEREP